MSLGGRYYKLWGNVAHYVMHTISCGTITMIRFLSLLSIHLPLDNAEQDMEVVLVVLHFAQDSLDYGNEAAWVAFDQHSRMD